ncbi:hypothetical protein TW80_01580 [Loktanella sp. S4079]|nr:hypothetical protein TW80_01580 [Loktanella sp. S4079]
MTNTQVSQNRLESLQVLRAVAALMVVAFHMNIFILPETLNIGTAWAGLNMGYAGVEVFFVLSGFIMFYRHGDEMGQGSRLWPYLYARFARIFPVFWVVLGVVIALRFAVYDSLPTLKSLLISMSMLPIFDQHIIGVQWTLSFELMFYLVFAIGFVHRGIGRAVLALWFAICALKVLLGHSGELPTFFFSPYNLLFLFGMLAVSLWRYVGGFAAALAIGGAITFVGIGLTEALGVMTYHFAIRTILYGLAATAMVCGVVALEQQGHWHAPKFTVFLGNASYAIYLVHITAMGAVAQVFKKLGIAELPLPIVATAVFVAAVLIGCFAHLLLERPLINFTRRFRPKTR